MKVLGNTVSFPNGLLLWIILIDGLFMNNFVDELLYERIWWWIIIWMHMLMNYYMNVYIDELVYECMCWLIWCYMMLIINDEDYGIIM